MDSVELVENNVAFSDLSVLYCEDSKLSRLKMSRYLSRRIPTLHVAEDGVSGLALYKKHRPQLIIADVGLPKMNGIEMCEAIRKTDPDVAIILVSVDNQTEYLHAAIELGAIKYMVKPVRADELMANIIKVVTTIEKKKFLSSQQRMSLEIDLHTQHDQQKVQQYVTNQMLHSMEMESTRHISISKADVNGDFYVVTRYKNTRYIMVADGAGHGLSAVLPALDVPLTFKKLAEEGYSLLTIADELNRMLINKGDVAHFVAATLLRINDDEEVIALLNCGNPAAILLDRKGEVKHKFRSTVLALGTVDNDQYDLEVEYFEWQKKDLLYVFTDGLPDTLIKNKQLTNLSSMKGLFSGKKEGQAFEHVTSLAEQAEANSNLADDITLLEIPFIASKKTALLRIADQIGDSSIELRLEQEDLKKHTLLIIDDDIGLSSLLKQQLERYVGMVYIATSSKEGLHLLQQYGPSIVLSSMTMAKIKKVPLLALIKKINPTVPVVAMRNLNIANYVDQLSDFGVFHYVDKPVDVDALLEVMRQSVEEEKEKHLSLLSASFFHTSSLAMCITDNDKKIVAVNAAFSEITGFSAEEVIGRNPKLLSSGKHDAAFYKLMWQKINISLEWAGEMWNRRKNGDLYLEWININAITDERGQITHYCSVFSDVTESKVAEESIRKLTYLDGLTGLPNRRLFIDRLEQELKKSERSQLQLAVLFLDLDQFKDVNDTLGHDLGDLVLKEAAQRLSNCVRDTDTVARLGGDEFTICLGDVTSLAGINNVTQNILNEMEKPFQIKDEQLYLSVSIGTTLYPDDAVTIPDLLKNADQAMFSAKESGRNCAHYFTSEMQRCALARKEMIDDLRVACEQQQFELYYQPVVEIETGQIQKVEALIRWHHPQRGFISPAEFIPIAEGTDIIITIGDWVFRQAALQAKKWQKMYDNNFQVSINKSPKQFQSELQSHQGWFDFLAEIDLPVEAIVVEITEGLLMDSNINNTNQLLTFRDAGIQVALDDFGTGYSSLSYLRKFDIDYLKIDRSFVSNLADNSDDQALCEAIIVMAHKLGIKVIAEGIETEQQRQLLFDAGCDYGQGYLFSKPLPKDEFEHLMGYAEHIS